MPGKDHICVCICTFKRPELLAQLLLKLEKQTTEDKFDYSVVVIDNDSSESARQTVENIAVKSKKTINYYVELEQNIALARNKAIEKSNGDFVGFIDDDEIPETDWLLQHHKAINMSSADGTLGPVLPSYDKKPPNWVLKGKFFERPTHQTGQVLEWKNTRTGNVLLKKSIFYTVRKWFDPSFGSGGEDVDFFRRMIDENHKFIWCNEAVVYEHVPTNRCTVKYLLNRALLRGKNTFKQKKGRLYSITKSIIALLIYSAIVPFCFIIGKHCFIKYLIKLCDHLGKILAFLRLNTINVREM
jgi:succinoglycan biosynthesis protein ExoM